MSHLATPEIEVDKIDVEEDFNARTYMDEDGLDHLAGSIGDAGVVQPIAVRPTGDGRYAVAADHRRYEAAKRAGLNPSEVPTINGEFPWIAYNLADLDCVSEGPLTNSW